MDDAKMLTSCIVKVLEEPSLAILVSQDTLVELERDVVAYLTDERLLKLDDAAQLLRVFNYLMLRLCENCDKTSVYGSLLQLLAKNMHSGAAQSKQTDLIMKVTFVALVCVCVSVVQYNVYAVTRPVVFIYASYNVYVSESLIVMTYFTLYRTVIYDCSPLLAVYLEADQAAPSVCVHSQPGPPPIWDPPVFRSLL